MMNRHFWSKSLDMWILWGTESCSPSPPRARFLSLQKWTFSGSQGYKKQADQNKIHEVLSKLEFSCLTLKMNLLRIGWTYSLKMYLFNSKSPLYFHVEMQFGLEDALKVRRWLEKGRGQRCHSEKAVESSGEKSPQWGPQLPYPWS